MSGQTNGTRHVKRQADVMQNGTDAGLVPGRRQNTMGLETSLGETFKICTFRQDTTVNEQIFTTPRTELGAASGSQIHDFRLDWTDFRGRRFTFFFMGNTEYIEQIHSNEETNLQTLMKNKLPYYYLQYVYHLFSCSWEELLQQWGAEVVCAEFAISLEVNLIKRRRALRSNSGNFKWIS